MVGAPRQNGVSVARDAQSWRYRGAARGEQRRSACATGRREVVTPTAHGFATPLWTLKRVRLWIEREFGVRYSEVHVWRLLGQLGLSNQKPDRRALEREPVAIENWRKRT
jgi:transposase